MDGDQTIDKMLDAVMSGKDPSKVIDEATVTRNMTKGIANAFSKISPKLVCRGCDYQVPSYTGRYPTACPDCGPDYLATKEVARYRPHAGQNNA